MLKYNNIVILTGAGISAESGLATFRDEEGLWNKHRVEDVATVEGFARNPEYVHDFYNEMKKELINARPNAAHLAITELQQKYPANIAVITQNVDTLHEKAGNQNVYHIHGQINQAVCMNCGNVITSWDDVTTEDVCEKCGVAGMFKPNIVFFGESLLCMNEVDELLRKCDLFISIGTSGVVFPANTFVRTAKYHNVGTIEFNLKPTANNRDFDRHIIGKAGETFPKFVQDFIACELK